MRLNLSGHRPRVLAPILRCGLIILTLIALATTTGADPGTPRWTSDLSALPRGAGVSDIAVDNEGRVYLRLDLPGKGGRRIGAIARVLPDGRLDSGFSTNGVVLSTAGTQSVMPAPDGGVWVEYGDSEDNDRPSLVRLTHTGALDPDFRFEPGEYQAIFPVQPLPDGGFLVVGRNLLTVGPFRILHFNRRGQLDPESATKSLRIRGMIRSWSPQAPDSFWVGGDFSSIDDHPCQGVARILGTGEVDRSFRPELNRTHRESLLADDVMAIPQISTVLGLPDGRILVGRDFSTAGQGQVANLIRLLPQGGLDPEFQLPNLDAGVGFIGVQADGRILLSGSFGRIGEHGCPHPARINANGTWDPTWAPELPKGGAVGDLELTQDGGLLIAGHGPFLTCLETQGTTERLRILSQSTGFSCRSGEARTLAVVVAGPATPTYQWNRNGEKLAGATNAFLDFPRAHPRQSGTYWVEIHSGPHSMRSAPAQVLIFPQAGTPGSMDFSFASPFVPHSEIRSAVVLPDDSIVVSGTLSRGPGLLEVGMAKLGPDGQFDAEFSDRVGPEQGVHFLIRESPTTLLAAGTTRHWGKLMAPALVRFAPDGTPDTAFAPQAPNFHEVEALALQSDKRILVAYRNATNAPEGLHRLLPNGQRDASFPKTIQEAVTTLIVLPDNRILVAQPLMGGGLLVRRLDSSGNLDPTFEATTIPRLVHPVLTPLPDGDVLMPYDGFEGAPTGIRGGIGRIRPHGTIAFDLKRAVARLDGVRALLNVAPNQFVHAGWVVGAFDLGNPGGAVPGFQTMVSGTVRGVLRQANGDLIVFGGLDSLDGAPCVGLGRLSWIDRRSPFLLGPFLANPGILLGFKSLLGWDYVLEATADVAAGSWSPVLQLQGTGGWIRLEDKEPAGDRNFYRLEARPVPVSH